jgi:hypothetical protein
MGTNEIALFRESLPALNVKAGPYFAISDGVTDNSVVIKSAHDSLTNGGTIFIPGRTKFSLTITNDNITVIGGGYLIDYASTNAAARVAWLPVGTNCVIRVGDNTRQVKGTIIRDATFYNPANEGIGLYWNTAAQGAMYNVTSWGFKDCILFQDGTLFPCTGVHGYNIDVQPGIIAGSRGVRLAASDYSATSYVTDISISGGHWNGLASGANTYLLEVDGAHLNISDVYMDFGTGHGVLFAKNGVSALDPQVVSFNVNLDAGGGGNVIAVDPTVPNGYPFNKWTGWTRTSGSIVMQSGDTYAIPEFGAVAPPFFTPTILSGAYFARQSSFTNHGTEYITASDTGLLTLRGSGGISLGDGVLGPITANGGSFYFDNNRGLYFDAAGGGYFLGLVMTTSDNMIVSAPTNVILLPINGESALYSFGTQALITGGGSNVFTIGNHTVYGNITNDVLTVSSIVVTDANKALASGPAVSSLQLALSAGTNITLSGTTLSVTTNYYAGTNVVFTRTAEGMQINVATNTADSDGYTLLPIVTTTDATETPIFTNAVPAGSMSTIMAEIQVFASDSGGGKQFQIMFSAIRDAGGVTTGEVKSFPVEAYTDAGYANLVVDTLGPGTANHVVTVQNNIGSGTFKWRMRYKVSTLTY